MRDRLAYRAYAAGWALVRRLPEPAAYALFRWAGDLAWRRRGAGVRRLETNLRRVLGPDADDAAVAAATRAGMRSYLRYWCDTFRLPDWDAARTVAGVRTVDEHHLRDALAAGRGVVAPLPHMGNWDHAGAWASRTGAPVTTVAERLRPEALYARFVAFRETLGMEILPLTGGEVDVVDALSSRLRAGAFVPLLGDRDLKRSGVEVSFFGAATRFPPGPALLALRTGADLVPITTWYDDDALVIRFHAPVPVPAEGSLRSRVTTMTQAVADVFAGAITAHPQDWHMLQHLWLEDLPAQQRRELSPTGRAASSRSAG